MVLPEPTLAHLFAHCDAHHNGELDRMDFVNAFYHKSKVRLPPGSKKKKSFEIDVGFQPAELLTPSEAWNMFDDSGAGVLGEYEFALLIEFLGLELSRERLKGSESL